VFDMEVNAIYEDFYELKTYWAEVNNCNDSVPLYSNAVFSNPRILRIPTTPNGGIRLADSLVIGDISDASFLDNNPFLNDLNVGKYYKLKFVLSNSRICDGDSIVIEQCVVFSEEPTIVPEFTIRDRNLGYVPFYKSTNLSSAPLAGYLTSSIDFEFTQGVVNDVDINLYLVDGSGVVQETLLEDYNYEIIGGTA